MLSKKKSTRLSRGEGRRAARIDPSDAVAAAASSRVLPPAAASETCPIEEPVPPHSDDDAGGKAVRLAAGRLSSATTGASARPSDPTAATAVAPERSSAGLHESDRDPGGQSRPSDGAARLIGTDEDRSGSLSTAERSSGSIAAAPELSPAEEEPLPPQFFSDSGDAVRLGGNHWAAAARLIRGERGRDAEETTSSVGSAPHAATVSTDTEIDIHALPGAHRMYPPFVHPSDVESDSLTSEASASGTRTSTIDATEVPVPGLDGTPIVGFVPHEVGPSGAILDDDVLVDRVRGYLQDHAPVANVIAADDHERRKTWGLKWCRRHYRVVVMLVVVAIAASIAAPAIIVKLSAASKASDDTTSEGTPPTAPGGTVETNSPSTAPSVCPSGRPSSEHPTGRPSESPSITASPSASPSISSAPTSETWSQLKSILMSRNASKESAFADAPSPQSRALRWLADKDSITSGDDNEDSLLARNSTERILVRYALAVLYYATGGAASWRNQYNWLSGNKHECLWHDPYECIEDSPVDWVDPYGNDCTWYAQGINCLLWGFQIEMDGYVANDVCCVCKTVMFMFYDMGVHCRARDDGGDPLVMGIILEDNNLTGTLPNEEMGLLKDLTDIRMQLNSIGGEIPPALGQLLHLEQFELYQNQLHGEIPSLLENLSKLSTLGLGRNQLTGTLPEWISNMSKLVHLDFWKNNLSGTIPSAIGSLVRLDYLRCEENEFTGQIPPSIKNLTNLRLLGLYANQFTGEIPFAINELPKLEYLYLGSNFLTGRIEWIEGGSTSMRMLGLWDNALTGSIPYQIGALPSLNVFSTANNKLNGTIPSELGSLEELEELSINSNEIMGTLPTSLGDLSLLSQLDISMNFLTGALPSELGKMISLRSLEASSNQFTGSIPLELGHVSSLQRLYLGGNRLTGSIPPGFGKAKFLQHFDVSNNLLNGTVPATFSDLVSRVDPWGLEWLQLHNNKLSGNMSFLCENKNENLLIFADCADPSPEVECVCCNMCCDREGNCAATP